MQEPNDVSEPAPILPWARKLEQKNEEPSTLHNGISLAAAGLELHDKIEVKWCLEGPDEESRVQWWGARILGRQDEEENSWNIMYDALSGFEEVEASVVFTSRSELVDNELGTTLSWRKEGELHGDTTEYEEDDIVTLEEIMEEDNDAGLTSAFEEAEIKQLPASTQIKVAEGLNEFKHAFEKFLVEVVQEKGEGYVIDVDDISKFSQKLRRGSK